MVAGVTELWGEAIHQAVGRGAFSSCTPARQSGAEINARQLVLIGLLQFIRAKLALAFCT
jgi:hypothetical protein